MHRFAKGQLDMTRSAIGRTVAMIGAAGTLAGAVVAGAGVASAADVPACKVASSRKPGRHVVVSADPMNADQGCTPAVLPPSGMAGRPSLRWSQERIRVGSTRTTMRLCIMDSTRGRACSV